MDAIGKLGIHPLVRIVACFKLILYGCTADELDEQYQISKTTTTRSFKQFCCLIVDNFGDKYLNRAPTNIEKAEILELNKKRGFPGMFGSWDCKHF